MPKMDFWNMQKKIPEVIVYYVSSDRAYNDDDGTIQFFDTEDDYNKWLDNELETQVYTGFSVYAVFRRK